MSPAVLAVLGPDTLPWNILQDLIIYLKTSQIITLIKLDPEAASAVENMNIITSAQIRKGQMSLLFLIYWTRSFDCTNARDRVFALLSMASNVKGQSLLKPDYTSSVEEVYKRVAIWDITVNNDLNFFSCGAETHLGNKTFPSWVPDFRDANHEAGYFLPDLHFGASGNRSILADVDRNRLTIKGRIFDEIETLGTVLDVLETPGGTRNFESTVDASRAPLLRKQEWLKECWRMAADEEHGSLSKERFGQFWRTMVWDTDAQVDRAPEEMSTDFSAWWDLLLEGMNRLEDLDPIWWQKYLSIAPKIEFSLFSFSVGRRFCLTKEGRLGSMPKQARAGDKICLLYGGKVPYVVRPCGKEECQYVGQCYVHGCMYGQVVDAHAEDEDIVLV